MFRLDPDLKVFLHREPVDGRKNINGLAALVEQGLGLDPFARAVYVFANKRRDRIKLLLWDRTGFWLMLKRLEADRVVWPKASAVVELSVEPSAQKARLPQTTRSRAAKGRRASRAARIRAHLPA